MSTGQARPRRAGRGGGVELARWDVGILSGTSMATPHTSGAVALLLSATGGLAAVDERDRVGVILDLMVAGVRELGEAGQDHRYGFGRVDVLRRSGWPRNEGCSGRYAAGVGDRIDAVIEDGSLRRLARERSAAAAPVLIEVTGPSADADLAVGRGAAVVGHPRTVTVHAGISDPSPPAGAASAVRDILGGTPRYLRAGARSFAAVATGAQLAALAASPAVAAIRPDRKLPKLAR